MVKKVYGWTVNPRAYRDEELIRFVTSSPESSVLERDLALRIDKLLYAADAKEAEKNPNQGELFDGKHT